MKKYNLIVVGGGISGIAAAVSAAREGMKVLLAEKFGSLGGAMSNSLVYPFMANNYGPNKVQLSRGIFEEMTQRKEKYNDTSWECYKFVFDDMITEAGVDVLFHATVFDVKKEGRLLKSVFVATKSGVMEIEADYFIDTSGDGELIAMAGCDFQLGREADGLSQPMTTCFRMSNVDIEQFKQDKEMLQEKYKQAREEGRISNPRENILVFLGVGEGIVHFNTTRIVKHSPVEPFEVSLAEIESRKQIWEIVSFLKENSKAFKDSCIISIASHIGVRESRKLKGEYILTVDDLMQKVSFEDTIALGRRGIDIHSPDGTGTYTYSFKQDEYYQIPYRSLLPKEFDNMLVAGRCLSAEHAAHSAVRIMPICACMGEATGIAVAVAAETGKNVHTIDVKKLREKLTEKGAVLEV